MLPILSIKPAQLETSDTGLAGFPGAPGAVPPVFPVSKTPAGGTHSGSETSGFSSLIEAATGASETVSAPSETTFALRLGLSLSDSGSAAASLKTPRHAPLPPASAAPSDPASALSNGSRPPGPALSADGTVFVAGNAESSGAEPLELAKPIISPPKTAPPGTLPNSAPADGALSGIEPGKPGRAGDLPPAPPLSHAEGLGAQKPPISEFPRSDDVTRIADLRPTGSNPDQRTLEGVRTLDSRPAPSPVNHLVAAAKQDGAVQSGKAETSTAASTAPAAALAGQNSTAPSALTKIVARRGATPPAASADPALPPALPSGPSGYGKIDSVLGLSSTGETPGNPISSAAGSVTKPIETATKLPAAGAAMPIATRFAERLTAGTTPMGADLTLTPVAIGAASAETQTPAGVSKPMITPIVQDAALATAGMELARMARRGESRFEMRLDPPELGRVDVRMRVGDDGQVRAHLIVEKPETLDMFLRDSRTLERALEQAGYKTDNGGLQFSLRNQGDGNGQTFADRAHEGSGLDREASGHAPDDAPTSVAIDPSSDGLDIRI